jgi:O-antigen/teichoic acid export membrane protein
MDKPPADREERANPPTTLRRALAANLLWGSLGRMVISLTPLLLIPLMIRAWGAPLYGEWLILTAIPTYLLIAPDLGLAGAVVNEMGRRASGGSLTEAVRLYRSAWMGLLATGAAFSVAAVIVCSLIRWTYLGVTRMSGSDVLWVCIHACVQVVLTQQAFLVSGVYKALQRNARYAQIQTFGALAAVGLTGFVLLRGASPNDYMVALTLAKLLLLTLLIIDARRQDPLFSPSWARVDVGQLRPYIVPGMGHAALPVLNALQNQGVTIAIGALLGPVSVAVFQTIRVLSNGVRSVISLPSAAIGAELSALLGRDRDSTVRRLVVRNCQLVLAIATAAFAVFVLWGEGIYELWLRTEAPAVVHVTGILLFASQIPCALGASFTILLLAANRIHRAIPALVVIGVVSLAAVAFGAMTRGLVGAAIGVVVWETGVAAAMIVAAFRYTNLSGALYWREIHDFASVRMELSRVAESVSRRITAHRRSAAP